MELRSRQIDRIQRIGALIETSQNLNKNFTPQTKYEALAKVEMMSNAATDIINEGDMKERVGSSSEIVLDAHLTNIHCAIFAKALQQTNNFSENDYIEAVRGMIYQNEDEPDYADLDKAALSISNMIPAAVPCLLGACDLAVENINRTQIIKQRRTRTHNKMTNVTCPENLDKLDSRKQDTRMDVLMQIQRNMEIQQVDSLNFYEVVVHPEKFEITLSHTYQIAQLVRDGKLAIDEGPNGEPYLSIVAKDHRPEGAEAAFNTAFCSWHLNKWKEIISQYNIREPMLNLQQQK